MKAAKLNRDFIEQVQFFHQLTASQKDQIAGVLIEQKFQKGQEIVKENDPASSFYIIKTGSVSIMKDGKEVRQLKAGDSFGENALLHGNQTRACSCIAAQESKCLALGRDQLTKLLGDKVEIIIYRNILKWALEKAEGFKDLSKSQKEKLLDSLLVTPKQEKEVIIAKGQKKKANLIVVLDGELIGKQNTAGKGTLFGETAIYQQSEDVYGEDMVASKDCTIGMVDEMTIKNSLGGLIKDVLKQNKEKS